MAGEHIHPPIEPQASAETTTEEDFADRAYAILALHGVTVAKPSGDSEIQYPVTDRVDLQSTDDSIEVALRLVRHPAFALAKEDVPVVEIGSALKVDTPSDNYMVLGLQYGTLDEAEMAEGEPIVDEDFAWHPYVIAVVHPEHVEVSVLDANTGKDLDGPDIMHAQVLMEIMARELSGIACESAMFGNDEIPIIYGSLKTTWEDFPEGAELDLNYECNKCGAINEPCGCHNSQMN
jgi:hypothetical protein